MDEEHIILLLAVIAVLVLAVAVVILLPKEKVAAPASEEEEKQRRRRSNKKPRQSIQVGNVKAKGIKGFDEVEDAEDDAKLLAFIRGTSYELNTSAAKKEQRKNNEDEVEEPVEEEDGEEFTKITKTQKKKPEGESHEAKGKGGRGKKKKLFFKPEIIQEMREGRKKDREEKQKAHEGTDQDKEEKSKKKKDQQQKTEEGASSSSEQEKKSEKKDKKPQNKEKGSDKESKETKESSTDQKPKGPRGPPRERDPNRPPRAPGLGRGAPRLPPPIRNTGLEPASLDDMLNAITNYYPPNIFQQRFGDPKILIRILSYLPFKTIVVLTYVDRFFHSFIKREDNIWRDLCRRDFGLNSKLPATKNFKQTYKLSKVPAPK